jgi:hypothetical protein
LGTAPTIASLNLTTALTLTGASGTAGQALTSGGSGVAPTWTTISSTPTAITNGTSNVTVNSSGGTITAATNGTTAVTIDTSQNVGIGVTPSATNTGKAVEIGTVGNTLWGIGAADLQISAGTYYNGANKYAVTGSAVSAYELVSGSHRWYYAASGTAGNTASFSESMRIDSSGNLLVGTTSTFSPGAVPTTNSVSNGASGSWAQGIRNTASSNPYGLAIPYPNSAPNSTGNQFIYCPDSTGTKFEVRSNGGIANFSANNVNLSDQREKKNIEFAGNYLNKICQIPIRTFLFNDQTDDELNLGAIAQEVQAVAPELVSESNWGTIDEPKMRLSIYQTDLQYALMKSIQELKAINDQQAETINALTARVTALENA